MNTCTECGEEILESQQYLAGVFEAGELGFFWACEHKQAIDAAVRLGSQECMDLFCLRNPQHIDAVLALLSQREVVN